MKRRSKIGGTETRSHKPAMARHRTASKGVIPRSPAFHVEETDVTRLTRELKAALEQQSATSEILEAISSAPSELDPIIQTIVANATRLCDANFGTMGLYEEGAFRVLAVHNPPPGYAALRRREPVIRPEGLHPFARVAATRQVLHIADCRDDQGYRERDPTTVAFVDLSGARSYRVPIFPGSTTPAGRRSALAAGAAPLQPICAWSVRCLFDPH